MSEEAIKQQLNKAKKAACVALFKSGYEIEKASNDIYCVMAMRDAEWRAIKVGILSVVKCQWFLDGVKKLEQLPCPDSKHIKKEVWLKQKRSRDFIQLYWKNNQWFTREGKPINLYKQ